MELTKKEYQHLLQVRELVATSHVTGTNISRSTLGDRFCLVGAVNHVTHIPQEYDSGDTGPNRFWSKRNWQRDWQARYKILWLIEEELGYNKSIEYFNDSEGQEAVLELLDKLIAKCEPKNMEIGKPHKKHTIEPAEPIPGVKEQPSEPLPTKTPDPVAPDREKVPA